ncbi:hypothetical protein ES288_A11G039200v1, partial [Gossypium darwinii]
IVFRYSLDKNAILHPSSPPSIPLSQAPLLFCRLPHHCPLPLFSLFHLHHHFSYPQQNCHVQMNEPLCPCRLLKCSGFSHSSSSSFFLHKVQFDAELCNHWCKIQLSNPCFCSCQLNLSFHFLACCYLQAAVLKGYPSEITLVSFYCLFGSIQSALVTLILKETQTLGC